MAKSIKSVSIGKAQVPVSCHFCNGLGTKWKCEECEVFMCSSCKDKVHGKLKTSLSHDVVSIYDISKDMVASNEVSSEVVTSIFNSYTISLPVISRMLCSNDETVYILDNAKSTECKLIKGKLLKASIRILDTRALPIFSFTVNKHDEILFTNLSVEQESPVQMISSEEITIVLDPKPMRLLALHVNRDNELICGLREQGPAFPIHDFSVRQIVIFDSGYRRKITLENDSKGRKLFHCPSFITNDSENVIYVSDWENFDQIGKLQAVDRTGHLKFSYSGPPDQEKFRPYSIAVTPKDNIILLEQLHRSLHVLNTKGILLALQYPSQLNMEKCSALCIDNEGFLLLGCSGKDGGNGKIHIVKMADNL